ncbi:MAG: phosphopantothenoylcysteine decarboxylase [Spirochaetia bacterium]|nr:phosphopantothenoylcysteine decarboxylase [Spirochaetia bacterium]
MHQKLIVTSGPTREWLDPVRFISNPSTGRMGWSIAHAGLGKFGKIVYISGPGSEAFRTVAGAENYSVDSTQEMLEQVLATLEPNSTLIMAAAPADYAPIHPVGSKIKKDPSHNLTVEFKPTPDILMEVAKRPPSGLLRVAFAAETDNLRENARIKMQKKDVDFICANEVFKDGKGFATEGGSLLILDRAGNETRLGPAPKDALGESLIDFLIKQNSVVRA